MEATETVSRNAGRYLVALYVLADGDDQRISTGELGTCLGVEPASVTEMFGTLESAGLLEYEPYEGGTLTGRGAQVASQLAWRECVVRAFFRTGLDVDLTDETAYRIGFSLPERGVERLSTLIDHPCATACPGTAQNVGFCSIG